VRHIRDILLLTVDEEITVEHLLVSTSRDHSPRFSPDGHWLAYVSNKPGQNQIYIRRFPDGEEIIVSNGRRASGPLWSTDGTELFFMQIEEGQSAIGTKMSAVTVTETENRIQISQPLDLFPMYTRSQTGIIESYSQSSNSSQRYGLLSDGRFLMLFGPSGSLQNEIVLVQNWFEELKRLAPPYQQ
jgi:Tol biopolymer transport system component